MDESYNFFGRRVIYTDERVITPDNVIPVLEKALMIHQVNCREIQYLYDYYRGNQPILQRTKEIREEINNKVVENRANEIVTFKVGYLLGEPVQYIPRNGEKDSADVKQLNDYMFDESKASKDKDIADWNHICGTAYRLVLPKDGADKSSPDESPFDLFTLDPRNTFVVRWSGLGHPVVMGVRYVTLEDGQAVFTIYTPSLIITCNGIAAPNGATISAPMSVSGVEPHLLGNVPIIEYPLNDARLGAFEVVLPLLDAINNLASNRIDGIEQFIQAILVLKGTDLSDEQFMALKDLGGISLPPDGDAKYLTSQLDQSQTQTLVNDAYNAVLTICGMPNRNGGTSTSDTGQAVIFRDGWYAAEARAKDSEKEFILSEREFLSVLTEIVNTFRNTNLKPSQIDIRFTRRNYDNIQIKAQVLQMLLSAGVHPLLAYEHCGMFIDPDRAYAMSMEYQEKKQAEEKRKIQAAVSNATDESASETVTEEISVEKE